MILVFLLVAFPSEKMYTEIFMRTSGFLKNINKNCSQMMSVKSSLLAASQHESSFIVDPAAGSTLKL